MSRLRLDRDMVEAAVVGGAVLGGGGGGSMALGRSMGLLAVELGAPELVEPGDLPEDAILVTASAVGMPSAKAAHLLPVHYIRAVELLAKDERVDGLVTNECGGMATVNGWLQAAALGIPVVDAPCNGRAHPTGVMGSMGLHRFPDRMSRQAAVGGDPHAGTYLELVVEGNLEHASALVRYACTKVGGMIAVARNPISVAYAREHAAVGAIRQAIGLGRAMLGRRERGAAAAIEAACDFLGGDILAQGEVVEVNLKAEGGFDVGKVTVRPPAGPELELWFWNEYAVCERDGERLATFPDLIATLDLDSGLAVSSAEIAKGQQVAVLRVPREKLILGAGMRDPELMRPLEAAIGKEIVRFVF